MVPTRHPASRHLAPDMLPVINTKQIRELDAHTIEHEPISSIDLMERASREFVHWFVQRVALTKRIGIVCGTGNNGGDGLAVARMLLEWGYNVRVWIVKGLVPQSEDFKVNLGRLKNKTEVFEIVTESDQGLFADRDVIVDAIFGSGLSRPVEGIYGQAIRCINASNARIIAIDIPSGLSADGPSGGEIVRANHTVTFQCPKLAFFFPQSFQYTGEFTSIDIGLNKQKFKSFETDHFLVTQQDIRKWLKPRQKFDHKGTYGHGLIVAGSFGKMGAAVLSSRAALRSGIGLLTVHVPKCGYEIMQTSVPEAMALVDTVESHFSQVGDLEKFSTIGIGPGLGKEPQSAAGLKNIFTAYRKPMVIDADALNMLAADRELLRLIPEGSILTPHPKEFERLAGTWKDDFERLEKVKALSRETKSVIVLKGAFTTIAEPGGKVYFNPTGNPGMASGGMGDVLTGILTGYLAQFYTPVEAAIIGVYLHGLAGDLAAIEMGKAGLIASDLVEFLPLSRKKVAEE